MSNKKSELDEEYEVEESGEAVKEEKKTGEVKGVSLEELYINPKENHYREEGMSYAWATEMNVPIREREGYQQAKDKKGKPITWGKEGEANYQVCMCIETEKAEENYRRRLRMAERRIEPPTEPIEI